MKHFKYIKEDGGQLSLPYETPLDLAKFAETVRACCASGKIALSLEEISEIAEFASNELLAACKDGMTGHQEFLKQGPSFLHLAIPSQTTAAEFIEVNGEVAVLFSWLTQLPNYADWKKIEHLLPDNNVRLVIAAYALFAIELSLGSQANGDVKGAMSNLARAADIFAVSALRIAQDDEKIQRSTRAKEAAKNGHAKSEKQKIKLEVKDVWKQWLLAKGEGRSVAFFARTMQDAYPVIESPRTIENWVREWKSEPDK